MDTGSGLLTQRSFRGALWVMGGTGVEFAVRLLVLVVLARILTPNDFGVVAAALVISGLSQIFSQLGVGPALVQRISLSQKHIDTAFTLSILLGAGAYVFILTLSPSIANIFGIQALQEVLPVISISFPVAALAAVPESLLKRDLRFRVLAIINSVSYVIGYGLVGIGLGLLGFGLWALVAAHLGQAAIKAIMCAYCNKRTVKVGIYLHELGHLANFGAGFSIARLANYVAGKADYFVIGRFLGADALGVYTRAYEFLMVPANLVGQVSDKVMFPAMATVQEDNQRLGRAYKNVIGGVAMVSFPLSAIMFVIAPDIIPLLLGEGWDAAVVPFQVLVLILAFRVSYKISDALVRAVGAVYRRAWRQCIYACAVFSGAWTGQFWGLPGASVGVAIAILINYVMMLQLSLTVLPVSWRDVVVINLRYLFMGLAFGIIAFFIKTSLAMFGVNGLLSLFINLCALLMFAIFLVKCFPFLLGKEGIWLLSEFMEVIQGKPKTNGVESKNENP